MRRRLNDSIKLEMSLKLALSLLTVAASTTAGAITWAYAVQQRIIDQTDQRREMRLQAYPSSIQLQQIIIDLDSKREVEYKDLRDRIDALRVLIQQK